MFAACIGKGNGHQLAFYIMELLEAFCGNGILPEDINLGFMAFLDKKLEAQSDGHTPAMVFRRPLDTRPLTLKQADNNQVAQVLNHCISAVIEKCAIDTQNGFIHGRQLAQNVIDLDFKPGWMPLISSVKEIFSSLFT